MLRKENTIRWKVGARYSLSDIKKTLTQAPMLISFDFSKYLLLLSMASEHTIAGVLLQKNQQDME